MNLVFCMAGLYKRFRDAGYTTPKFLLPWDGRPVMEWIVARMYDPAVFAGVVFVANRRDREDEGDAWPLWKAENEAILQPPKPEIRPARQVERLAGREAGG